jgi:hypothetical protein
MWNTNEQLIAYRRIGDDEIKRLYLDNRWVYIHRPHEEATYNKIVRTFYIPYKCNGLHSIYLRNYNILDRHTYHDMANTPRS